MARGHPDYGNFDYITAFSGNLQDQAFIARRGIAPLTNVGRVYFADFFDQGANSWYKTGSTGGAVPKIVTVEGKGISSPFTVNLFPAVNGGESRIEKKTFSNIYSKHAVEVIWFPTSDAGRFQMDALFYLPGNILYWYTMGYNPILGTWYTGTNPAANAFRTEAYPKILEAEGVRSKFVFEVATGKFDKAFIGDDVYDLGSRSSGVNVAPDVGLVKIRIANFGASAALFKEIYIGGVIWTVDEP